MSISGWIGVDLDGTLAKYEKWDGSIGAPIPAMISKVKAALAEGVSVKIFTARVTPVAATGQDAAFCEAQREMIEAQREMIDAWCRAYWRSVADNSHERLCLC